MPDSTLPRAMLFDMDDTIIAQTRGAERLWNELCERYAPQIPGVEPGKLLQIITETRVWFWGDIGRNQVGRLDLKKARRTILGMVFDKLNIDDEDLSVEIADTFTTEREIRSFLFEGAIETLERLRSQGKFLAMITNGASDMQRGKINKFKLEPLFDYICIEGEFGKGKPAPEMFSHTLEQIGVSAEDACMIGDDLGRDILGAEQSGIYSIWVDWRKEGLPDQPVSIPDRIIHSITELV